MGPVRMISSGHELTTDYDEKTLHMLGFKDMQMVFVSLGAPRRERKGDGLQLPASCLPPPQKENTPMILLLQDQPFTALFDLLEMLASFGSPPACFEKCVGPATPGGTDELAPIKDENDEESWESEQLCMHAEQLSHSVWELLMLLPTCPSMLQAFQDFSEDQKGRDVCWKELLRSRSPQKLLYALEIIEALSKPSRRIRTVSTGSYGDLYPDSDDSNDSYVENSKSSWSCKFIAAGGLELLLELLLAGTLEPKDGELWNVWQLDCLACLLKLICQFAVEPADFDISFADIFTWSPVVEGTRKRTWPTKGRKTGADHTRSSLIIPRLTDTFLKLVNGSDLLKHLMTVSFTYNKLPERTLKVEPTDKTKHEGETNLHSLRIVDPSLILQHKFPCLLRGHLSGLSVFISMPLLLPHIREAKSGFKQLG
uniref:Uncharacterized protein n=1 Tax=Eptatretus burgeri TaxID=7764 RepID=A0A8C4QBU2_EPTBU